MPMPVANIVITGAGGFLGSRLVHLARRQGLRVTGTIRPGTPSADVPGVDLRPIDLAANVETWRGVLAGADVVIHAAARAHVLRPTHPNPGEEFHRQNVLPTRTIAQAALEAGVRRIVFVSSIGAIGNVSGQTAFSEETPPHPVTPYAVSKLDAEKALLEIGKTGKLEVSIVRPPLVYGPDVKGNFARLLALAARGVPLPLGSVRNVRSLIYVDNLADLLLTASRHPAAAGETFVAADGTDLSTPQLWRELVTRMSKPARLLPFPPALIGLAARILGQSHMYEQLCASLEVDASKARQRLGWAPPVAPAQALDITVQGFSQARQGRHQT